MVLVTNDLTKVEIGMVLTDFRGDKATVIGWAEPKRFSSTGRIYVQENGFEREYYPSVYNCKFIEE